MATHILLCSGTSELHVHTNSILPPQSPKSPISPSTPETASSLTMLMQRTDIDSNISIPSFSSESICMQPRETIDMHTLLMSLSEVKDDHAFAINGYKKLNEICDTLQGKLYKAQKISTGEYVAIKKTEKILSEEQISIQDGCSFCVAENIVKESAILKHLTVDNRSIGDHIIQYIDFFADDTAYYLVMEYIESEMNLKQFVSIAHEYIAHHKLNRKDFKRAMKYILWQLAVTIRWLHDDMRCSHLDLCTENIMLKHCNFKEDSNGNMMINPSISVKLGDFGVSELFNNSFMCNKTGLSLESEPYVAPKVYNEETYDARSADMWAFGMIICQTLSGEALYDPVDIWLSESDECSVEYNGYIALHNGDLKQYLARQKSLKCFTNDSLKLLLDLLDVNEKQRLNAMDVLQHDWFKMYYRKYQKQIARKIMTQKKRLKKQSKSDQITFYNLHQY